MNRFLEDREQLHYVLLGVELVCIFAFVGLSCYAVGWIKSAEAHGALDNVRELPILTGYVPVPGWVGNGLLLTVGVLLTAVAIDIWLLLDEEDIDLRKQLRNKGDTDAK